MLRLEWANSSNTKLANSFPGISTRLQSARLVPTLPPSRPHRAPTMLVRARLRARTCAQVRGCMHACGTCARALRINPQVGLARSWSSKTQRGWTWRDSRTQAPCLINCKSETLHGCFCLSVFSALTKVQTRSARGFLNCARLTTYQAGLLPI